MWQNVNDFSTEKMIDNSKNTKVFKFKIQLGIEETIF